MARGAEIGWAAAAPATAHVLVDGPLSDELTITGDDAHHLTRARRVRAGETVTAADGVGHWRAYEAVGIGRGTLTLRSTGVEQIEPCLLPGLGVAFALTKGEKPESVVARLTELGVDRIRPVTAQRSVVRWDEARTHAAADRFQRVAREAAMQCRRSRLPVVEVPAPLTDLVGTPGLVVADRRGEAPEALPDPGPGGWLLVVGPEGGLAHEELEVLAGAPRLAVGPHVLRAETAAVAAAAALSGLRHEDPPDQGHGG